VTVVIFDIGEGKRISWELGYEQRKCCYHNRKQNSLSFMWLI